VVGFGSKCLLGGRGRAGSANLSSRTMLYHDALDRDWIGAPLAVRSSRSRWCCARCSCRPRFSVAAASRRGAPDRRRHPQARRARPAAPPRCCVPHDEHDLAGLVKVTTDKGSRNSAVAIVNAGGPFSVAQSGVAAAGAERDPKILATEMMAQGRPRAVMLHTLARRREVQTPVSLTATITYWPATTSAF
jgi:hypothetical protein